MQVSQATAIWIQYHKSHSRRNTLKAYRVVLSRFCQEFGDRRLNELTSEEILSFLNRITEATKQQTKHTRYTHLTAFFNFIRNHIDENFRNPCNTPMMKRLFRKRGLVRWNTIEKEIVDEIIFKTPELRNRLSLRCQHCKTKYSMTLDCWLTDSGQKSVKSVHEEFY